jgi:cellulose biosynthesis protein BcsQ
VTRIVAVAGAGSSNIKSTTATNLAVAISALGLDVELRDLDPAGHSIRALTGAPPAAPTAAGVRWITLSAASGRRARVAAVASSEGAPAPIIVVECAPRLDAASERALLGADLVLVPLDASALARRALQEVAGLLDGHPTKAGGAPPLRAVLSRLLPRAADRWSLVETIGERDGATLYEVTLPMGRATTVASGAPALAPATLYSPAGRAAAAYRAVARLIMRDLGLAAPAVGAIPR